MAHTTAHTTELMRFMWRGGWGHLWRRPGTSYWIDPQGLERALSRLDDRWLTDTYFGVHPARAPKSAYERARAEDIVCVNCLYADFDVAGEDPQATLARIEAIQPAPSVIVASGGGFHAYWLLTEPFHIGDDDSRALWAEVQRWWVRHVGADPAACDLARLLRVPGTLNGKYDPPRPVYFVRCDLDALHDPDVFVRAAFEARESYEQEREQAQATQPESAPARPSAGESPIERYNRETNIRDLLRAYGYTLVGERYFVRPGKDPREGISGTIDDANNRAYTFSSNDPAYDPANTSPSGAGCTLRSFDLLCRLSFGGDAKAAVRWLTQGEKAGQPGPAQNGSAPPTEALPPAAVDALAGQGQDDDLSKFDPDDAGNGDALAHVLGERYLYSEHAGWFRWTGTHYERENAEKLLEAEAVDVLRRRRAAAALAGKESVVQAAKPSMQRVRAAIARLASLKVVSIASFDQHPHLLNVRNCVVDLRTGEILAHETSYRFTTCINAEYDPEADYTEWVNWLSETVRGGDKVLNWLQAWLGYAITGETSLEQLLYVYGPPRSGKGTLTETLLALMGGLAKTADFASFTRRDDYQNFDLAALRNARLVVAGEGMRAGELNAARIKKLTGGDEVSCAYKHRDIFTYKPQYKLVLVSNHKLNVDVDDDAAWARVRVVEFPNSHLGQEDVGLKHRMRQPDNLRAVLAWLVQGARTFYEYLARGQAIPTPETVQAATREHRDALDFVSQWMTERLARADTGRTTARECWQDYSNWCNENGVMHPKGIRAFREALEKRGVIFERTMHQRGVMKGWILKRNEVPW
jgi:P4 family phage/plasmid primase-like protien